MALFDEPMLPYYQFLNREAHVLSLSSGFSLSDSWEIDR